MTGHTATAPSLLATPAVSVAVLGIGLMGFPMARRLCEAGVAVRAWTPRVPRPSGCCPSARPSATRLPTPYLAPIW